MDASANRLWSASFVEADRLPLVALALANLVPLAGVLWFGWDASGLLILYWLENLVIGAFTVFRMLSARRFSAVFPALFFLVHFGAFCAGHGLFILAFSGVEGVDEGGGLSDLKPDEEWFGPLVFFQLLGGVIARAYAHAPAYFALPLVALIVSHGLSTFVHHWLRREDAHRKVGEIMTDPYRRIFLLHAAVIGGGVLSIHMGQPVAMLLVLVVLKIGLDVVLHRHAHARRQRDDALNATP